MNLIAVAVTIIVTGLSVSAQTISLSGIVSNQAGKPIQGAVVVLAGRNIRDTTGENGQYFISNKTAIMNTCRVPSGIIPVSFAGDIVSLNLSKPSPVIIELFDIQGHLIDMVVNNMTPAGEYRVNIHNKLTVGKMTVIRISSEDRASIFRYLVFNNGRRMIAASGASFSGMVKPVLAKNASVIDSFKVTAENYMSSVNHISSYEGQVDIILDTLDNFSFFVTSLEAIIELSGNRAGFGGDLRFGKTGPGAGILGADSICECIAEKSMPGSKVKVWHAFLSAAEGPDGGQVDAMDRIGNGPWYDREGRLVAPTLADLLNKRPQNGDPEIQDDLPNEYGIPNHRPDPTKPEIDNHHTLTGTGEDGRLYAAEATCNDWTSSDTSTPGKPRMGFSWPRATGWVAGNEGRHWISGWDGAGCGAGVDIETATLFGDPKDRFVGSGGGYGGFYCFALRP